MSSDTPRSKAPERRMRGFEAAGGLLRERIRTAGETRGFAVSRLLTHWPEVVGAEIAAQTLPVKIGYAKGGFGASGHGRSSGQEALAAYTQSKAVWVETGAEPALGFGHRPPPSPLPLHPGG